MVSKKKQLVIAAEDVPHVFDDACIRQLVNIGRLPETADLQRFADSVREAARIYARDARKPSEKTARDEIEGLHRAASQRDFKQVAERLKGLSPQVRQALQARASTIGFKRARLKKLPSPNSLLRRDRRERACDVVRTFCSMGGSYIEGRRRGSGKPVTTFKPRVYAPEPIKRPPTQSRTAVRYASAIGVAGGGGKEANRDCQPVPIGPAVRQLSAKVPTARWGVPCRRRRLDQ